MDELRIPKVTISGCSTKPGSTEAHVQDDAITLVKGPFSPLEPCTH